MRLERKEKEGWIVMEGCGNGNTLYIIRLLHKYFRRLLFRLSLFLLSCMHVCV